MGEIERESTQELAMPVYLNAGDKSQASLSLSLLAHLPLPLLLRPTTSPLALRVAFMASFKINHSCKSKKRKKKPKPKQRRDANKVADSKRNSIRRQQQKSVKMLTEPEKKGLRRLWLRRSRDCGFGVGADDQRRHTDTHTYS